jgi:hypothetical protein
MKLDLPIRLYLGAALGLMAAIGTVRAQPPRYYQPAPYQAVPRSYGPPAVVRLAQNGNARPGLKQWIERHQNLSPEQQQRELQNEPGFRGLPPQMQMRELQELRRLQGMTPEQRGRREALLGMTPLQRQQFTAAVGQFTALPPNRRILVKQAFNALRRVPVPERQAAMSSYPPLRQFSPYERQTLVNLLYWEPYFTAQQAMQPGNGQPGYGQPGNGQPGNMQPGAPQGPQQAPQQGPPQGEMGR